MTYELRRRGYDVEAQPTYSNDVWPQVAYTTREGARLGRWRGAFRDAKTDYVGVRGSTANTARGEEKVLKNIADKMKSYGDGARAIVNFAYRGRGIGHVFNVEKTKGGMVFVDAQSGERYTAADMRNFAKVWNTASVSLTRTDNLRVSDRVKNFVWNRDERKRSH